MKILVLNCGSSSVKFQLIETEGDSGPTERDRKLLSGLVDRLGNHATFRLKSNDKNAPVVEESLSVRDQEAAVRLIIERLGMSAGGTRAVDAVGHRVVHGANLFTSAAVIDDEVLGRIESLNELAPLHNPASVSGIHAARKVLGASVPMTAVFDTAFHHTIPDVAATYAIPDELSNKHGIRRYGFHGLAHRYSLLRYSEIAGIPEKQINLVTLHLGNGCSGCAIRAGESVDTSMGFTPLEGLVMGTRSGDLDPALVSFLARKENVTAAEVERWLNERSGLRGLSGISNDMRELIAASKDDARARLAVDVFCYRARKYLGAYMAVIGVANAVIFSGGIGENATTVREKICEGMEWCGVVLDKVKNDSTIGAEVCISPTGARSAVYVIPSDEEAIIARETARLFQSGS
ncbi:MAG TPA: acetate kinase [Candidatus Binatia bacterium]|nr:acetate kinase [Candidatus Binatia bacterium]